MPLKLKAEEKRPPQPGTLTNTRPAGQTRCRKRKPERKKPCWHLLFTDFPYVLD